MRPTSLKPGDKVRCGSNVLTFLRRERLDCRPAVNWFQCDAYRGLDGPTDDGRCTMNDARVIRHCTRAH